MDDFDREFGRTSTRFNWFFGIVVTLIVLCFLGTIAFWAFVALNIDKAPEIIGDTAARIEKAYEDGKSE